MLDVADRAIAARIVEIQHAAYAYEAALIGFDDIPTMHESVTDVQASVLQWEGVVFDERLVGLIAWSETPECGIDIDRLAIDPRYCRRGFARDLVANRIASGRVVTVSTGTANLPACRLYEQLGFRPVETRAIASTVTVTEYLYEARYLANNTQLRHRISHNLNAFDRRRADASRRASVAVLLAPVQGVMHYVMSQRALTLRRGAGQYALPGGGIEDGESAVEAALREVHEELGVALAPDAVLGMLDDLVTRSGHVITPVVMWSDAPISMTPDPTEVQAAWLVPVAELDRFDAPRHSAHPEGGSEILRMPMRGEWINPPTAAVLLQFRDLALHARPTRVHNVGQPTWTAR